MKNISKEDILNSEIGKSLFIDFIKSSALFKGMEDTTNYLGKEYDNFKQEQLKPKVDWEILSFRRINGNGQGCLKTLKDGKYQWYLTDTENSLEELLSNKGFEIHSIKRLSDNCIFTLGDKINFGEIKGFEITKENNLIVNYYNKGDWQYLSSVNKAKTPIFSDFLGNDVFEEDYCYYLNKYNPTVIETWKVLYNNVKEEYIYFKNKSDAEEYLLMHSKVLSLEDLNNNWQFQCIKNVKCVHGSNTIKELKQLIRQKLKIT